MKPWTWLGLTMLIIVSGCGPADSPTKTSELPGDSDAALVEVESPCVFLPADSAAAVELVSEPNGASIASVLRHEFVAEARSGDWVLVVAAEAGRQGWVDGRQGTLQGNCAQLEELPTLPPLAANVPTAVPPTCVITLNVDTVAYTYPTFQETYATLGAGTRVEGMAQAAGGWYGFDPRIEQPGVQGVARLRWLPVVDPSLPLLSLSPHCSALPVVQYP